MLEVRRTLTSYTNTISHGMLRRTDQKFETLQTDEMESAIMFLQQTNCLSWMRVFSITYFPLYYSHNHNQRAEYVFTNGFVRNENVFSVPIFSSSFAKCVLAVHYKRPFKGCWPGFPYNLHSLLFAYHHIGTGWSNAINADVNGSKVGYTKLFSMIEFQMNGHNCSKHF